MIRLFKAWSAWDNVDGFDCVRINWFCQDKNHHPGRYAEIIKNYGSLSPADREYSERIADEYLTGIETDQIRIYLRSDDYIIEVDEIAQIRTYLQRNNYSFEVEEIPLPIDLTDTLTLKDYFDGGEAHVIRTIPEPEKHGITFDLGLCYCLAASPLTVQVPSSYADNGQEFMERLMKKLNIAPVGDIRKIVEWVYQNYGAYVQRNKYTTDGERFASFVLHKQDSDYQLPDLKDAVGDIYRETELHATFGKSKWERIEEKQRWLAEQGRPT